MSVVNFRTDNAVRRSAPVDPTGGSNFSVCTQSRILGPTILVGGQQTQVLTDQCTAVAPESLGELVGHVTRLELDSIDAALRLVLALD